MLSLSGSAPVALVDPVYVMTGDGTLTLSGLAELNGTGSGTITLGGSASSHLHDLAYEFTADGTATLSGSARVTGALSFIPSGSLTLSGESDVDGDLPDHVHTGAGSLHASESAATSSTAVYVFTPTGIVTTSGHAATSSVPHYAHTGAGACTLAGLARLTAHYSYTPGSGFDDGFGSGFENGTTLYADGEADSEVTSLRHRGAGSLTTSGTGSPTYTASYSFSGSGSLRSSGTTSTHFTHTFAYTGAGTRTLGGSAKHRTSYLQVMGTGFELSGSGNPQIHYVFIPGGGFDDGFDEGFQHGPAIYLGGSIVMNSFQHNGQGGLSCAGSATTAATYITTGSGTVYIVRPDFHELDGTIVVAPLFGGSFVVAPLLAAELSVEPLIAEVAA